MKHITGGKTAEGVLFFPSRLGQSAPIPYILFSLFSKNIIIYANMEFMYCHSLKIAAKYHDDRVDIFNVGSIFP